jgi:hypothetical protein
MNLILITFTCEDIGDIFCKRINIVQIGPAGDEIRSPMISIHKEQIRELFYQTWHRFFMYGMQTNEPYLKP